METFSEKIKKALLKFFMLDVPKFSEVVMKKEVAQNICEFARSMHPKEFVAVIGGKVEGGKLIIIGLYYQEFVSSNVTASFSSFMPASELGVGTVHSHPSSNIRPSDADRIFFSKKGAVHFIIGYPYTEKNIAGYDYNGNEILFTID